MPLRIMTGFSQIDFTVDESGVISLKHPSNVSENKVSEACGFLRKIFYIPHPNCFKTLNNNGNALYSSEFILPNRKPQVRLFELANIEENLVP